MILAGLSLSLLFCSAIAQSNGDIRLVESARSGRLEIYLNSKWGTVCDDGFGASEAQVVCQQLGYVDAIDYGNATILGYSSGSGQIWLDEVNCSSSYLHILDCSNDGIGISDCSHDEDVAVSCSSLRLDDSPYLGQVRLVGGSFPSQGLVEVYCSGKWGTICNDYFGDNDAKTICQQLGYNTFETYNTPGFLTGSPDQPIWLGDVYCSTSDVCLLDCLGCPDSTQYCSHSEDVNVKCSFTVVASPSVSRPPVTIDTCQVFSSVQCPDLPNPLNGEVTLSNNTNISLVAMYSCYPGYILNGEPMRICRTDGSWLGYEPYCDESSYYESGVNVGLVVGIVVGILGGSALITIGTVFCVYCVTVQVSKETTTHQPITQNVEMVRIPNATTIQVPTVHQAPPSNPELQQPRPPSYSNVQTDFNTPDPVGSNC